MSPWSVMAVVVVVGTYFQHQLQKSSSRGRSAERGQAGDAAIFEELQGQSEQQTMHILTNSNNTNSDPDNPNKFFRDKNYHIIM